MKKKFFILIILCLFFIPVLVSGQDRLILISRQELKFDENLTDNTSIDYARPQKILVSHIEPGNENLLNNAEVWLRLFHYYGATRLGLSDIPFNYVIDRSGNIYEGLENAEGRVPYIGVEDGAILIVYLSPSHDLTVQAQRAFKDLVENYSYKFGISKDRVEIVDLVMKDGDTENPASFSYKSSESLFQDQFVKIAQGFKYSKESTLRFSGTIEDLKYETSVNSGEKLKVEFNLKNTDSFPWYVDEGFVFLTTGDGEESLFAVNQVWDSFSKPFALEAQLVLPKDTLSLSFELDSEGVLPGTYEEIFKFVMLPEIDIQGTEFKVEFDVTRGDRKIVQISPTGTGALTVYKCPEYTCPMVAAAISGEKYLVLEEEELWYKISVDGVEGYVTIHYATLVD